MSENTALWVGFNLVIFILLVLDLFVFNKKEHSIKVKEALLWTAFWFSLAALFCVFVYFYFGPSHAEEFATGYLIEQALSVDNLFVILMLFTFFRTPTAFQHKVLFWGILGAIFFRITFILAGVALIERFEWTTYILGGFLIFTSIKMIMDDGNDVNPDKNIALRIFSKIMPVAKFYDGSKFFVRKQGVLHATPLFIVLIVVETTDIVFAVDSIPAILAVSTHPFIVYSSNIFAVMGLRSLYFALAGIMELFHFLKYGLSVILMFIGAKVLLHKYYPIDTKIALIVVVGLLGMSVLLSIFFPEKDKAPEHNPPLEDGKAPKKDTSFPVKERKQK